LPNPQSMGYLLFQAVAMNAKGLVKWWIYKD